MAGSRDPLQARADGALGLATLIWGTTFVVVQQALVDCSTLLFLGLRFTLAALVLAIVFRGWERVPGANRAREWRVGLLAGVLLFSGYLFQTWGLLDTTPSKSAFITGLNIVLVPLFVALFQRRLPQPPEWAGISTATVGMGLMTLDPQTLAVRWGDALTFVCAFVFSVHILLLGRYSPQVSIRNFTLTQVATAAGLALLFAPVAEPIRFRPTPQLGVAVAITAILATALAFGLMTWAQKHTSPTRAALIFALEPVFAAVTSYMVLGERLAPRALAGAALILAGVLLVELKPGRRLSHPSGTTSRS